MPALALCAVLVLIRVLTLGTPDPSKPELNVLNGLGQMWNLDAGGKSVWAQLANGKMWMEAAGQIFFSLSVGFGVIITYASYMRRDDDIALSSTTAVAGNEFFEVSLGGMITIPAAFIFFGAAGAVGEPLPSGSTPCRWFLNTCRSGVGLVFSGSSSSSWPPSPARSPCCSRPSPFCRRDSG